MSEDAGVDGIILGKSAEQQGWGGGGGLTTDPEAVPSPQH